MKSIFIFFSFLFATTSLVASYTIKIAVYKDHANLMRFIAKVPKERYRKNIIIEQKNHLNYVTSVSYEYEKEVHKALRAYKKVFPDAFIEKDIDESPTSKSKKPLVKKEVHKKTIKPVQSTPILSLDAQELLGNKTVYLCKESPSKRSKKGMIELGFKDEYVLYRKLSKTASPLKMPYVFDKDSVTIVISEIEFKYKILQKEDHFLAVQSFVNSKKGQKFRFYFNEDLAFRYDDLQK